MSTILILCLVGYIVGSIPSGFLLARAKSGADLRKIGSKSTGATNVLRTSGKKTAAFTLGIDIGKGVIIASIVTLLVDQSGAMVASFFCIVGHVYPIWLGFKGGKGVATSAGIFLVFSPISAIISALVWGTTLKITKTSSFASILFIISLVICNLFMYLFYGQNFQIVVLSLCTSAFIAFTHRKNIKRIINMEEKEII